jgi:hypothetical protein
VVVPSPDVARPVHLLAALSLAATVSACGSGSGPASNSSFSSVLPQHVQRTIAKDAPVIAYVPRWLPAGYRYSKHSLSGNESDLWFSKPGETPDALGLHVREAHCPGGATHTFRVRGMTVSWSGTYEDQQAWRCFTHDATPLVISASRSISGDSALDTPQRRQDALLLARLAANTEHIG